MTNGIGYDILSPIRTLNPVYAHHWLECCYVVAGFELIYDGLLDVSSSVVSWEDSPQLHRRGPKKLLLDNFCWQLPPLRLLVKGRSWEIQSSRGIGKHFDSEARLTAQHASWIDFGECYIRVTPGRLTHTSLSCEWAYRVNPPYQHHRTPFPVIDSRPQEANHCSGLPHSATPHIDLLMQASNGEAVLPGQNITRIQNMIFGPWWHRTLVFCR